MTMITSIFLRRLAVPVLLMLSLPTVIAAPPLPGVSAELPGVCAELPGVHAELPALAVDLRELTVSGVSSGAYMAVQFQVAYSQLVRGAGIIAGGPYDCAEGSVWRALTRCMLPSSWAELPSVAELRATAGDWLGIGIEEGTSFLGAL